MRWESAFIVCKKYAKCQCKDWALRVPVESCILGLLRIYVTTAPTATVIKGKPCVVHFKRNCWKTTDASAVQESVAFSCNQQLIGYSEGRKEEGTQTGLFDLCRREYKSVLDWLRTGLNITENCRLTAGTKKLCDLAPPTFTSVLWGETLVFICYHADGENKHTVGMHHINLSYEVINRHLGAPPLSFGLEAWCELPGGFDNGHDT